MVSLQFGRAAFQIVSIVTADLHSTKTAPTKQDSWTLSVHDRSNDLVISPDRLACQSKGNQWQGVHAARGVLRDANQQTNRFYYEAYFTE